MSEPLARADLAGDRPEVADVRAALAAGWHPDQDGWWVRAVRRNDPGEAFFAARRYRDMGFLGEGKLAGIVFCRTPAAALAYDRHGAP